MKRDALDRFLASSPSIQELRRAAKMLGLRLKRSMKKRDVIKLLRKYGEKLEMPSSGGTGEIENNTVTSRPFDVDLPRTYEKDSLVLLPVSPLYVFSRWDFSRSTLGNPSHNRRTIFLRLYDVTNVIFDGKNANSMKETRIDFEPGSWYFRVDFADANYVAELGYYEESVFVPIMKSNCVTTPRNFPKFSTLEKWKDMKNKDTMIEVPAVAHKEEIHEHDRPVDSDPSSEETIFSLSKSLSGGRRI